jgi:hypothetical protein
LIAQDRSIRVARKNWKSIFINELAESSNVKAACEAAVISQSLAYKARRADPDFARQWFEALAEGYDKLEMDLLLRLREGRLEDVDAEGNKRKFDIGTAFRCLTAHRETVAREKGRQQLADEAVTLQSINAKIDALRANEVRARKLGAKRQANKIEGKERHGQAQA